MKKYIEACFLFGAGINAYGVIKYLKDIKILGIIDSNLDRCGEKFEQLPIISLEEYKKANNQNPIVITAYQSADEIISLLEREGISNFLLAPFLQSNVTSIEKIVDHILYGAKGRKLLFDDTLNIMTSLVLDELNLRNVKNQVLGVLNDTNKDVCEFYNLEKISKLSKEEYLISCKEDTLKDDIDCESSTNICNLIYYNPDYMKNEFLKFKNIYKNRRCFVIGNGPSLRMDDLDRLSKNKEICFGSNGIFLAYSKTIWRPDYYVIADFVKYMEYYDEIIKMAGSSLFIKTFFNLKEFPYPKDVNVYNSPPQKKQFVFSEDIAKAVYSGAMVTFNMLQIAAYMGFTEIYLLGVDFSFDFSLSAASNHFDTAYEKTALRRDTFYYDENLAAYKAAEEYSKSHGFKIYNATRGGKLEVFERVNFDELF